eukprot:TRINITY_DN16168_c0_g4_i2.p1 TRINITY_DN16168_c0_g4~~TRINITY_DN16168_c0_g4_i2.p1  ORF type:complete len:174 (-),score=28.86 TRINITY_DN16168_c0_g4_i2:261-782(-)
MCLTSMPEPTAVPGQLRQLDTLEDNLLPTLVSWYVDFFMDAMPPHVRHEPPKESECIEALSKLVAGGNLYIWEVEPGAPRAMAGINRQIGDSGKSLNLVFADRAYRGQGFGKAVVTALCRELLTTSCSFVALFADARPGILAPKTYERIGFTYDGLYLQRKFQHPSSDTKSPN